MTESQAQPDQLGTNADEQPLAAGSLEPNVARPTLNPELWIEKYGDELFGFAAARVRERATAEDLVQETFLAALKARDGFAGRSTERGWLFGILRNKLVDYYRASSREVSLDNLETILPEEQSAFGVSGFGKNTWLDRLAPKPWETPDKSLSNKEFQGVLRACLSRLPDRISQVFRLREMDSVSTDEICKDLGVSPNNLGVMLHRARMGLRRCLEIHWFRRSERSMPRDKL